MQLAHMYIVDIKSDHCNSTQEQIPDKQKRQPAVT